MTKLVANGQMLKAMRKLRRDATIQDFLHKAAAGKLKVKKALEPPKKPEARVGDPTPQRVEKADPGATVAVTAPPFNTRILPLVTRYADRLGPETILILESLYEVGRKGQATHGLTAGYDGIHVDVSRTNYAHLTPAQSKAHNKFHRAMAAMPPELRRCVSELLLNEETSRKPLDVARELCGYEGEHHQRGALVAALRIIAWCVRAELAQGGRDGTGRKARQQRKEVHLP